LGRKELRLQMALPAEELPELMTNLETAKLLRMSPRTLEGLRMSGNGPPFTKTGPGRGARVLYRRSAVLAWLAQFDRDSTS
jgi:hypothetical protein